MARKTAAQLRAEIDEAERALDLDRNDHAARERGRAAAAELTARRDARWARQRAKRAAATDR